MYTNFKVKEGQVFKNEQKGKKVVSNYIGDDFNITGYKVNMDTGEIIVKIQAFSARTGEPKEFEIDRATMTPKKLIENIKSAFGNVLNEKAMYDFF